MRLQRSDIPAPGRWQGRLLNQVRRSAGLPLYLLGWTYFGGLIYRIANQIVQLSRGLMQHIVVHPCMYREILLSLRAPAGRIVLKARSVEEWRLVTYSLACALMSLTGHCVSCCDIGRRQIICRGV